MKLTDSQLLDALEMEIKKEPLLLWAGDGPFPQKDPPGLSLVGGRSLREAIQSAFGSRTSAHPKKNGSERKSG